MLNAVWDNIHGFVDWRINAAVTTIRTDISWGEKGCMCATGSWLVWDFACEIIEWFAIRETARYYTNNVTTMCLSTSLYCVCRKGHINFICAPPRNYHYYLNTYALLYVYLIHAVLPWINSRYAPLNFNFAHLCMHLVLSARKEAVCYAKWTASIITPPNM